MPRSAASTSPSSPPRTKKYIDRQAVIVRAAVRLINQVGLKAMALADVAEAVGVVPTGINYYFSSKEELAARCFLESLGAHDALVAAAEAGQSPSERLRVLVKGFVELRRAIDAGERESITFFNDVKGLNDPRVNEAFIALFRRIRGLIAPVGLSSEARAQAGALAHLILSQLHWSIVWLRRYDLDEYDRAAERMLDMLEHGLGAADARWQPWPISSATPSGRPHTDMHEHLLRSATQMINEYGYQGASAEKISAQLNLTKGAFYHYVDAKDDLVLACFRRTIDVVQRAQRTAEDGEDAVWPRLVRSTATLVEHHLIGDMPLLRTSALNSFPAPMKAEVLGAFDRISLRFASMLCDGVMDGSLRPVDVNIGGEMITAMINAAAELSLWTPSLSPQQAVDCYVRALLQGLAAIEF